MKILGISAYYHDSAIAIIDNGNILFAAQEERFSRKKNDANFPKLALKSGLSYCNLTLHNFDLIVFYDKPFLKFERMLETYLKNAPWGFLSFVNAIPIWLKEKLFLRKTIIRELKTIDKQFENKKTKIVFSTHHLSHAASAFFPSNLESAAIVTIDGVGEWATASIASGIGNKIVMHKEMHFPNSVGLLYSAFTYFLGFKVNSGEYKLMGLAPYGNINSNETKKFIAIIKEKLITIFQDGSIEINTRFFNYTKGLSMVHKKKWERLFGILAVGKNVNFTNSHCNLALAIQTVTEEIILLIAKHAKEITGQKNLCLAGGVALNCVANGKLTLSKLFNQVYIQPAAGDAGAALGAALAVNYIIGDDVRKIAARDAMQNAFLGNEFSDLEINKFITENNLVADKKSEDNLIEFLAQSITENKIIGVFKGRMEFGPRALGNRSIIANPSDEEMQKKLNVNIKFREGFRPFAAMVTEESASDYFTGATESPYMLKVFPINETHRNALPINFNVLSIEEKLMVKKTKFPAVTHADFSCRIQTVNSTNNPFYYKLLQLLKEKIGFPMLINTSFNMRGEPIVCSLQEAYNAFMRTKMDILVIENYIFYKSKQPIWKEMLDVEKIINSD